MAGKLAEGLVMYGPMPLQSILRQSGTALAGFGLGGLALFWLPWLFPLFSRASSGAGPGVFLGMLGTHVAAVIILALAYALLYAVHLLLPPQPHAPQPLRLHLFTGAMGGGLFYLLTALPFFQDHPVILVLAVLAAVLALHFLWERLRRPAERPPWL